MDLVSIKVYPRIHVTLLDMSDRGYRINGGAGFSINEPNMLVKISFSNSTELIDSRINDKFPHQELKSWLNDFSHKFKYDRKYKIEITGSTSSHIGLGSSTAVRMACIEGIYLLNNIKIDKKSLIKQSSRGGTSGIGVNTYFEGGFIFDIGHERIKHNHGPSRTKENANHQPLVINSLKMPKWEIGILIPKDIQPIPHDKECEFFKNTCPIAIKDVYETTYHIVSGLIGSIKTKNFNSFTKAINAIQKLKWKSEEWRLYPKLLEYKKLLFESGATCVGMSSLGPSLYFLSKNLDSLIDNLSNNSCKNDFHIIRTTFRNDGRDVTIE